MYAILWGIWNKPLLVFLTFIRQVFLPSFQFRTNLGRRHPLTNRWNKISSIFPAFYSHGSHCWFRSGNTRIYQMPNSSIMVMIFFWPFGPCTLLKMKSISSRSFAINYIPVVIYTTQSRFFLIYTIIFRNFRSSTAGLCARRRQRTAYSVYSCKWQIFTEQ